MEVFPLYRTSCGELCSVELLVTLFALTDDLKKKKEKMHSTSLTLNRDPIPSTTSFKTSVQVGHNNFSTLPNLMLIQRQYYGIISYLKSSRTNHLFSLLANIFSLVLHIIAECNILWSKHTHTGHLFSHSHLKCILVLILSYEANIFRGRFLILLLW